MPSIRFTSGEIHTLTEYASDIGQPFQVTDPRTKSSYVNPEVIFSYIVSVDPSRNKQNAQWLLTIFLKKKMALEDAFKATEYLTDFERAKPHMPLPTRDIMQYPDLTTLYEIVEPYKAVVSQAETDRQLDAEMAKQAKVVYNDAEYKIVIPLTWEASKYYGRNTQWCTTYRDNPRYFNEYTNDGPLYIILKKANNQRWQFHFASNQFMNENDQRINLVTFAAENPKIAKFFEKTFTQQFSEYLMSGDMVFGWLKTDNSQMRVYDKLGLGANSIGTVKLNNDDTVLSMTLTKTVNHTVFSLGLIDALNMRKAHGQLSALLDEWIAYDEKNKKYGFIVDIAKPIAKADLLRTWVCLDCGIITINSYANNVSTTMKYYQLVENDEVLWSMNIYDGKLNIDIPDTELPESEIGKAFLAVISHMDEDVVLTHTSYKPSDFMSPEEIKTLVEIRPLFGSLNAVYRTFGDSEQFRKCADEIMDQEDIKNKGWVKEGLLINFWPSQNDFVDDLGNDTAKQLVKAFEGAGDYFEQYEVDISSSQTDLLESLEPDELKKLGEILAERYPDEIEDDDEFPDEYDPTDVDDILKLQDMVRDDELDNCLHNAVRQGYESGAENEAYEAFYSMLNNVDNLWFHDKIKVESKNPVLPKPLNLRAKHENHDDWLFYVLPTSEVAKLLTDDDNYYSLSNDGWFDVLEVKFKVETPYYGWTGYDDDAAADYFGSAIHDAFF